MTQCRDVRELTDAFLGDELLTETMHDIVRHLDVCRSCRSEVEARRQLRTGIGAAFARASHLAPDPRFATRLRQQLQTASRASHPRRTLITRGWSFAAAAVIVASVGGFSWTRSWTETVTRFARAAVGDHRDCAFPFRLAERPVPLDAAAANYGEVYRAFQHTPATDFATPFGTVHIRERHLCVYQGQRFVHEALVYGVERVSLLIPDPSVTMSLAVRAYPGRQVTALGRVDGVQVVAFRSGGRLMFVAGDVSQAALVALAESIAGPLDQSLAGT